MVQTLMSMDIVRSTYVLLVSCQFLYFVYIISVPWYHAVEFVWKYAVQLIEFREEMKKMQVTNMQEEQLIDVQLYTTT